MQATERPIVNLVLCLLLAGCILISSKCQASTCRSTCPGSVKLVDPSHFTEQDYVTHIKCQLSCVQMYYNNPQWVTTYSVWPSYNQTALNQDCYTFQKVEQCKSGCTTQSSNPQFTINQCRNRCYSQCSTSCNGSTYCTRPNFPCERKCRRPVCRRGCQQSYRLQGGDVPLSPLAGPILTPVSPSNYDHFRVSVPDYGVPTGSTNNQTFAVNFLFKVVDLEENITWYYWQTDLTQVLKLTAFTCRQVEVSFAVVSNATISQYSPATRICITDPSLLPPRVSNYTVQYAEDTRAAFTGYAVVKLTWNVPGGNRRVTSYSFQVLSLSTECGGHRKVYPFDNIQSNSTEITIRANKTSGFLRFGCRYPAFLKVHPAQVGHSITHIQLVPTLEDQKPDMSLQCNKKLQIDGSLRVTLKWTVPPPSKNVEAIRGFQVRELPYGSGGTIEVVPTQRSKFTYTHSVTISSDRVMVNHTYTFLVRPLQNELYYWRPIPNELTCKIHATPTLPLSSVKNVSILDYDHVHRNLVRFTAMWNPSAAFLTHYELIMTEGSTIGGTIVHKAIFPANQTSAKIELHLGENITAQCLYLQITAYRWSQPSNPSKALVLPRSSQCVNSSVDYDFRTASGDEGRITVYYEGEDSATKVLDIGCSGVDESSFTSIDLDKRLRKIEDKLAKLSRYLSFGTDNLSLDARLNALNQKLDTILTLHANTNN